MRKRRRNSRRNSYYYDDLYGYTNPANRYKKPYDYGMYHTPGYNIKYNNWKRHNIYTREDYNPDRYKRSEDINIEYPLAPVEFIDGFYTQKDYDQDCKDLKTKYIQMCKYPMYTRNYNGNKYGFECIKTDMKKRIKYCNQVFQSKYQNNQIKPIYFMRKRKQKGDKINDKIT